MATKVNFSNPEWFNAERVEDILPEVKKPTKRALRILELAKNFPITQGKHAGKRFGDVIMPWQERFILGTFSCRKSALKASKNSGKTLMEAALANAIVLESAERGANKRLTVIFMSASIEAAKIAWDHLFNGINNDDYLSGLYKPNIQSRELVHIESGIVIKVIAPEMRSCVGRRILACLIDEVHECSSISAFSDCIDQLMRGGGEQDDFTFFSISTAPISKAKGYYLEWISRARAVRDGLIDDPDFYPALFEWPIKEREDLSIEDTSTWWRGCPSLITEANPNGIIELETLIREFDDAKNDAEVNGARSMMLLASQRLGIEAEDRDQQGHTLLSEYWSRCVVGEIPDEVIKRATPVFACDPSAGMSDPFAVVLLYLFDNRYWAISRQFLLKIAYDQAPDKLKYVYDAAIEAKELSLHNSSGEMELQVLSWISKMSGETGDIMADKFYGGDAAGLAGWTRRFELKFDEYIAIPQGWQLGASFHHLAGLCHDATFSHLNQPLLTENIMNLRMENDRLKKADAGLSGQGFAKVDGAFALMSAVAIATEHMDSSSKDFDDMVAALRGY